MFVYDFVSFDTHTQTNAHAGKSMFFVCVCVFILLRPYMHIGERRRWA